MERQRIHYIDVTKGLLMLLVIYGHIYGTAGYPKNSVLAMVHQSCNLFIPFYMPCFFIVTGMCSNFHRSLKEIVRSGLKTILIPSWILSLIMSFPDANMASLYTFIKNIILYGGSLWFLSTLFISRILYSLISRYLKNVGICVFVLFIAGYTLQLIWPLQYYWWFDHALLLTPFLYIGEKMKSINPEMLRFTPFIYIFIFIVTVILSHNDILQIDYFYHVPGITQKLLETNLSMFLPFVLLSVMGGVGFIYVCRFIEKNTFLEYIGRNSLIIYCIHGTIMIRLFDLFDQYYGRNDAYGTITVITLVYFITILLSMCIAKVFNLKYFKFIIGKY